MPINFSEVDTKLDALDDKQAGHLVKHTDWNALVGCVRVMAENMNENNVSISDLDSRTTGLRDDLDGALEDLSRIDAALGDLQTQVEPLLNQYVVKTSTESVRYSMGQLCEITADVTNLFGEPVTDRPWIDFVASWGRLRPVSGFESRGGVGDNSISVRVNSDGIARVILRTEHVEGFTEAEETQVSNSLLTLVQQSNASIAQTFLEAPSPTDFRAQAAFRAFDVEYDRTDSNVMRTFADTYFMRTPEWLVKPARANIVANWRDYRATVMAMAKPDNDPQTADSGRGYSSIQITFRDWISPWIKGYVGNTQVEEDVFVGKFIPFIAEPFVLMAENIEFEILDSIQNMGIIGRQKIFEAAQNAIERAGQGVTDPEILLQTEQMRTAVASQAASDTAQLLFSLSETRGKDLPAMAAITGANKKSASVERSVQAVSVEVEEQKGVKQAVNVLEGRMQAAEQLGQTLDQGLDVIGTNVQQISVLDQNSIQAGVNSISAEIAAIRGRLG